MQTYNLESGWLSLLLYFCSAEAVLRRALPMLLDNESEEACPRDSNMALFEVAIFSVAAIMVFCMSLHHQLSGW